MTTSDPQAVIVECTTGDVYARYTYPVAVFCDRLAAEAHVAALEAKNERTRALRLAYRDEVSEHLRERILETAEGAPDAEAIAAEIAFCARHGLDHEDVLLMWSLRERDAAYSAEEPSYTLRPVPLLG